MKSHLLYNSFHLGDCLIALHLVRALAKRNADDQFIFFTNANNLPQLAEVAADLPNIFLFDFENPMWGQERHRAIDCWKNSGGAWEGSPLRWDWSGYHLWLHEATARTMGFDSPFSRREHLLLDYPGLDARKTPGEFDVLVVNSEPCSGQVKAMTAHGSGLFDELVRELDVNHRVITTLKVPGIACTMDYGDSISGVGCISRICRVIVGVATGPWWPCLSTHVHHNATPHAVLLDEPEHLNMPNVSQFGSLGEVRNFLKGGGWL